MVEDRSQPESPARHTSRPPAIPVGIWLLIAGGAPFSLYALGTQIAPEYRNALHLVLVSACGLGVLAAFSYAAIVFGVRRERITRTGTTLSELRKVNDRFRQLVDVASDAIFLVASNGYILDSNVAACALTLVDAGQLNGMHLRKVFSGGLPLTSTEAAQGGIRFERNVIRPDGSERFVEVSVSKILDDKYVLIARDMTAKRRAEEGMEESQRTLRTLMENLPGMAYRCVDDGKWTMTFASKGAQELTGYNPEEITGSHSDRFCALIHPEDRPVITRKARIALQERKPFFFVYRLRTASGEQRWVWERGHGIYGPDGSVESVEGFIADISQRVQTEDALKLSENRYRAMVSAIPDSIFRISAEGIVLDFKVDVDDLMLPGGVVVGDRLTDVMPAEMIEKYPAAIALALETRQPQVFEYSRTSPEGERTFEARFMVAGVEEVLVVVRNVTARKQAESMLAAVVSGMPVVLWAIDRDGRFTLSEGQGLEALGLKPGEIVGQSLFEVYRDNEAILRNARRALDGDAVTGVVGVGGLSFETRMTPVRDNMGNVTRVIGVSTNVTERVRAEDMLHESEDRYRKLLELAPLPLVVHSMGKISYANKAASMLVGVNDPRGLIGLSILDFVHPDYRQIVIDRIAMSQQTQQPAEPMEEKLIGVDGRIVDIEAVSIPIVYEGKPAQQVVMYDITMLRHSLSQLQEAMISAERANRLKSEFLANMSHEIRTPLNLILGYSRLLREQLIDGGFDADTSVFREVERAGQRLMGTIGKIIDISRFHIEDFPMTPQVLNLGAMTRECTDQLALLAESKGLMLEVAIPDRPIPVLADAYALSQAILNVIENAIKYTNEGIVRVTLGGIDNGHYELAVQDTGIGVGGEFLPHIFDEFSQEHGGYGRPFEGTGLGMALAKKFVEASGGRISVESERAKGTTVRIVFPVFSGSVQSDSTRSDAPVAQPADGLDMPSRGRIQSLLVVEDDEPTQQFMRIALSDRFEVYTASDAVTAREVLSERTIDAILMDLSISGKEDGIQLTQSLRSTTRWRNVPVIALTAHALDRDRENALGAGCNAYLSKPFQLEQLFATIESLLSSNQ